MLTSKVTVKGQVTIPSEVRAKLDIRAGDVLVYEFDKDSAAVRVSKLRPFDAEWNSAEDDEAFADLQQLERTGAFRD